MAKISKSYILTPPHPQGHVMTVKCEEAKEKYRGVFEIQKSGDKTSSGEIGLDIRTHASPKVGQDQVSGGVSVLCWHAEPIDELTVQVWLLYHPNFKYHTLFVSGAELQTDGRTDRQTGPITRCPRRTFQKYQHN